MTKIATATLKLIESLSETDRQAVFDEILETKEFNQWCEWYRKEDCEDTVSLIDYFKNENRNN